MPFIEPDLLDGPGLSVGQDDGFADKLGLSLIEFDKDRERSQFGWHDVARLSGIGCAVAYESVQLVTGTQSDIAGQHGDI